MRFIAALFSLLLVLAACPAAAGGPVTSRDPLFGLPYTAESVRFDPAPPDLLTRCPELVNERWTRRLWVFAHATLDNDSYFVLGGFFVPRPGRPAGTVEADTLGVIAHLQPTGCVLAGPAREVFDYQAEEISLPALQALAADGVRRYAAAYGGLGHLREALAHAGAAPGPPRAGILRGALDAARE